MSETTQDVQPEFAIQRLYTKDLSFETPNTPDIFAKEWKPEVSLNLQTVSKKLEGDTQANEYEVVLTSTVTAKLDDQVAFLCEVQQAGIFTLKDFPDDQKEGVLNSLCPSILFPYAREVVSDLIVRGGFPQLYLAPINFEALYAQQLEQKRQGVTENETEH